MYPTSVNEKTLIALKTQELKRQLLSNERIEALVKSGKLQQTIDSITLQVKLFIETWFHKNQPKIIYQISTGTQYASDDEIFLDADFAVSEVLKLSKDNLDNFYVLWEFEEGYLPHPSKVFFDGKVYSKDDKYDDI